MNMPPLLRYLLPLYYAATLWIGSAVALAPTSSSTTKQPPLLPRESTTLQRHLSGIGLAVLLSLPVSPTTAVAATTTADPVIKINVDIPALVQIANDNKDTVLQLAQQTSRAVSISQLPPNVLSFVRDLAAGDVYIEINGSPIDISLLSDKGILDVDIATQQGDISVTLSSGLLPKLPFLSKRPVPSTAAPTQSGATIDGPSSVARSKSSKVAENVSPPPPPAQDFWSSSAIDPFNLGWTNQQVLGTTALGLGLSYGASYAYYVKSGEEEELAAQSKRNLAAAKKGTKSAAVAEKGSTKEATKANASAISTSSTGASKDASKQVVDEKSSPVPETKLSTAPAKTAEGKVTNLQSKQEDEPSKRSRWRFWNRRYSR